MAKKKDIPKQPTGKVGMVVWMATYHTFKFCAVMVTITACIILLSIKYSGKNIEIEPKRVMEKLHEKTNR